jgi:hypothetical protein
MSYRKLVLAGLIGLAGLYGCQKPAEAPSQPWQRPAPPTPATVTVEPPPAPPEPVPLPILSYPIPPEKPSPVNGAARPSPVVEADDPDRLVGLDLPETTVLLGDPAISEEQPPGKILTYVVDQCRLEVFFYPDLTDQHFKALTYEFSGIDDTPEAQRACFASMLQRNGT